MIKIRVLVVDDAVVMRRIIGRALDSDPQIEVVGSAPSGVIALQKIPQVNPDVITLDVEMPEMSGIETLRLIRASYPKMPVIMFSTLTQRGAASTLEALTAGATDYVAKPANVGSVLDSIRQLEEELIPKIKAGFPGLKIASANGTSMARPKITVDKVWPRSAAPRKAELAEILCIASSTGGPNALNVFFAGLGGPLGVPVVIVQHMPPLFTKLLAEGLGRVSPLRFYEAAEGQRIEPGSVYIAPGGKHLELYRSGGDVLAKLHEGPPENSCRPSADVLFRSVAELFGSRTLGLVLTGMGKDGLRGCEAISAAGGRSLAQDEASSVVWGMPGHVSESGLAEKTLPLESLAAEVKWRLRR